MFKTVNVYIENPIYNIKEPIVCNTLNLKLSVGDILNCICRKATVDEILTDGTHIRLNLKNYNKDNSYLMKNKVILEPKQQEVLVPVKKEETIIPEPKTKLTREEFLAKKKAVIEAAEIKKEETISNIEETIVPEERKNKHKK